MSIIDFRARPNTREYMNAFGLLEPEICSLDEFVSKLTHHGVSRAVYTNRQGASGSLANDVVADHVSQHPAVFIGFGAVDPRRGDVALDEFERCINDLGMHGLALDPPDALDDPNGRAYDDRVMYPLYERAEELDVPVVLTFGPRTVRFGAPAAVDRVSREFPDLKLVCSHAVWPEVNEWIAVALRNPNVVLEPSLYWHYPGTEPFFEAADRLIPEQVVYASGFPFNRLETINDFRALSLSDDAWERITYKNASRLLKIDS